MVWHTRAGSYVVVNLDDAELFEVTPQDALSYAREDILSGFRVLIDTINWSCGASMERTYDGRCFVTKKVPLLGGQALLSGSRISKTAEPGERQHTWYERNLSRKSVGSR